MSFRFLPLPLFILLALASAIGILFIAWKVKKNNPRTLFVGYHLLAVGVVGVAVIRLNEKFMFLGSNLWLIKLITLLFAFWGIISAAIGKYLGSNNDQKQRRSFLRIIYLICLFVIIMALFFGFLELKMRGIL